VRARCQTDGLGEPNIVEDVRSVVIYDDFDNPILIVQKLGEGQILTTRATDPEFRKIMKSLGIGLNAQYRMVKNGS